MCSNTNGIFFAPFENPNGAWKNGKIAFFSICLSSSIYCLHFFWDRLHMKGVPSQTVRSFFILLAMCISTPIRIQTSSFASLTAVSAFLRFCCNTRSDSSNTSSRKVLSSTRSVSSRLMNRKSFFVGALTSGVCSRGGGSLAWDCDSLFAALLESPEWTASAILTLFSSLELLSAEDVNHCRCAFGVVGITLCTWYARDESSCLCLVQGRIVVGGRCRRTSRS